VLDFFYLLSLWNCDFVFLSPCVRVHDLFDFDRSTLSSLFWWFFFDICGVVDWIISFVWKGNDLRNGYSMFSVDLRLSFLENVGLLILEKHFYVMLVLS
jgi:hypothetical protein